MRLANSMDHAAHRDACLDGNLGDSLTLLYLCSMDHRHGMGCSLLLLDARPPRDATRPGGLGQAFDWRLLSGAEFAAAVGHTPWWLAGGLTPATVADAITRTRPQGVDVSSGVESAPGVKDPAAIRAFVSAARAAFDLKT